MEKKATNIYPIFDRMMSRDDKEQLLNWMLQQYGSQYDGIKSIVDWMYKHPANFGCWHLYAPPPVPGMVLHPLYDGFEGGGTGLGGVALAAVLLGIFPDGFVGCLLFLPFLQHHVLIEPVHLLYFIISICKLNCKTVYFFSLHSIRAQYRFLQRAPNYSP